MSDQGLPNFQRENIVFGDYPLSDSSLKDKATTNPQLTQINNLNKGSASLYGYAIPLANVRSSIFMAEKELGKTIDAINDFLLKINIDPYFHHDLLHSHTRVCEEAYRYLETSKPFPPPFICFEEFLFAERYRSSASKMLINKYMQAVGHSTYAYLFYFRKIAQLLQNEVRNMKYITMTNFGGDYADESEQKVALQFDSWAKTSLHYAQRITAVIFSEAQQIDTTEVDQISQVNAAKFQTFFAIKLNSINNRVDNLIENLFKDLKDNSRLFYDKYLNPTLKLQKEVSSHLEIEYDTTLFSETFPQLTAELIEATNILKGNFYGVYTDLYERLENAKKEVDLCFELIHEKRKYSNYISQLSQKTFKKQNILSDKEDNDYNILFRSILVDEHRNNSYRASHSDLDDLGSNDHPQYLLRDGGVITGDITVENGATIDGVNLATHAHTGSDGSARIRSIDIDYSVIRADSEVAQAYAPTPLSLSIEAFQTKIIDGGQPSTDVILSIVLDDESALLVSDPNNVDYEFEIFYTEIEDIQVEE